jgi:uncharacterized protein (DUF2147 family)
MIRRHHIFLSLVMLLTVTCARATPAAASSPPLMGTWLMSNATPTGRWVTPKHDAVIQIVKCGGDLCGQIIAMSLPPGSPVPNDWRGQSQCNLTILRVTPDSGPGQPATWRGFIMDPRDGEAYHATITLDAMHHLMLHAFIGLPIFGETQNWSPYCGASLHRCRMP